MEKKYFQPIRIQDWVREMRDIKSQNTEKRTLTESLDSPETNHLKKKKIHLTVIIDLTTNYLLKLDGLRVRLDH